MSLKTVSADRDLSFLHLMESKDLNLFGKLRSFAFVPKGMADLVVSVRYYRRAQSHSIADILPSFLMAAKPEGPGVPSILASPS